MVDVTYMHSVSKNLGQRRLKTKRAPTMLFRREQSFDVALLSIHCLVCRIECTAVLTVLLLCWCGCSSRLLDFLDWS